MTASDPKALATLKLVLDALGVPPSIESVEQRKRIQKSMYLVQAAGLDLGYRYSWYKMGPYSPELARDYYCLADMDASDSQARLVLRPLAKSALESLKPVFRVPDDCNLTPTQWLELLASIDFLRRYKQFDDRQIQERIETSKPHLADCLQVGFQAAKRLQQ